MSLEHAHNQTIFQDAMVSEHGRGAVEHVRGDADAGWETMLIPPDCERVPSAGGVAGSRDAGRETMPIPPDCERLPGSGIPPVSPMLVGRRCRSRQIAHTYQAQALPLAYLALTGRLCRSRQTANACLVTVVTPATLSLCGFTLTMVFWSRCFFQDGRRLRRTIDSLASDHFRLLGLRGPRDPLPCWKRMSFGVEYTFGGTRLGS